MPRTFFHDITLEVLLCGNSFELVATVEFTATPVVPATYWQPAEGGEVEVLKVIDLFVPEIKERAAARVRVRVPLNDGEFVDVPAVKAKPRIDIDPIPPAFAELILSNVDEESLFESVDFDGDDREYEYDPRD